MGVITEIFFRSITVEPKNFPPLANLELTID
jgi:hypothetical protein